MSEELVEVDEQTDSPSPEETERMVEALLFASAMPLSRREIASALPDGCDVAEALEGLRQRYCGRGVELRKAGSHWAFRTAVDLAWMFDREQTRERKLSRAALETLAIIAYHQPVTRAQIEEIRGVAVSRSTIHMLLDLGWIGLGSRRQTPGRPVTFRVTDGFLDHFGLESVRDLPGLAEIKELGLLAKSPEERASGEVQEKETDLEDSSRKESREDSQEDDDDFAAYGESEEGELNQNRDTEIGLEHHDESDQKDASVSLEAVAVEPSEDSGNREETAASP